MITISGRMKGLFARSWWIRNSNAISVTPRRCSINAADMKPFEYVLSDNPLLSVNQVLQLPNAACKPWQHSSVAANEKNPAGFAGPSSFGLLIDEDSILRDAFVELASSPMPELTRPLLSYGIVIATRHPRMLLPRA